MLITYEKTSGPATRGNAVNRAALTCADGGIPRAILQFSFEPILPGCWSRSRRLGSKKTTAHRSYPVAVRR